MAMGGNYIFGVAMAMWGNYIFGVAMAMRGNFSDVNHPDVIVSGRSNSFRRDCRMARRSCLLTILISSASTLNKVLKSFEDLLVPSDRTKQSAGVKDVNLVNPEDVGFKLR